MHISDRILQIFDGIRSSLKRKNLYSINWATKYIYFSSFSPRIKKPFIISLAIHLIIFLLAYSNETEVINNNFTVEISRTAEDMAIKEVTKFSELKDILENGNKKNTHKSTSADRRSLLDGLNQENKQSSAKNQDGFLENYEDMLFNQKKSMKNLNERKSDFANEKLKWDENRGNTSHSEKEKTLETISVPGGKGESQTFIWKEGYSRKLVFEPEIEYPLYFRKQGIQASVHLTIEVSPGGSVLNAEIRQSSGYSKLDILARNGLLKAKFAPRENTTNSYDRGEVEVQFRLNK